MLRERIGERVAKEAEAAGKGMTKMECRLECIHRTTVLSLSLSISFMANDQPEPSFRALRKRIETELLVNRISRASIDSEANYFPLKHLNRYASFPVNLVGHLRARDRAG